MDLPSASSSGISEASARNPDRVVHSFQRLVVAGKQQHMRAFLREFLRDGAADPARGAGDEGEAILEALLDHWLGA